MRMAIVSDIHLGRYKYGKINTTTGHDLRTEDIIGNLDQSIKYAIENKADVFVITGDFYHKKRPFPIFRQVFASRISSILKSDIDVFLLLGNHDQGKTSGHDLVELLEVSSHIDKLHIIDQPTVYEFNDSLLCFLPCVNKIDNNVVESEKDFNISQIKLFTEEAKNSKAKYNFFFGHFGTDKSVAGSSFDLGSLVDPISGKSRMVSLAEFDPIWTRVYLGDIHKNQELNSFCRHVGSIARVDFGEENENKGFYFFVDGKDEFIEVNDRQFKTFEVDLTNNPREKMKDFCDEVQDFDLSQAIVRIKIRIKSSDRKTINFDGVENYLREESWNYIGKTITEITDQHNEITLSTNNEINHIEIFRQYTELMKDKIDMFDDVAKEGEAILTEILES